MPTLKSSELTVQAGDVIDLVGRLRRFMSDFDGFAYTVDSDFSGLGADAETAAVAARPLIRDAADGLVGLLEALEKTPAYKRQRQHPRDSSGGAHG